MGEDKREGGGRQVGSGGRPRGKVLSCLCHQKENVSACVYIYHSVDVCVYIYIYQSVDNI